MELHMSSPDSNGATMPSPLSISSTWEKSVVAAGGGRATFLVAIHAMHALPGHRRAPLDVAFVLDRSGSMTGEKLALMKEAVTTATALLHDEDRVALVTYDQTVDRLQPLMAATSRAKANLRLALHGVDAGGTTNLSGGWLTGCDELAQAMERDRDQHRIRRALLLTDGLANEGITEHSELVGHATSLRKLGVSTTTLGVGLDFDEHLLATMSEAGGGNFQFIESAGQLSVFFQKELGELLTAVATGLTVSIAVPDGVHPRLINAFPAERKPGRIEVAVGDIPAGSTINLAFDLEIEAGAVGSAHHISMASTWAEPATDKTGSFQYELPPLTLVAEEVVAQTVANQDVQEEVALQRADVAQREAMRLDREGRHAESRAHLRQHVHLLAAAPQTARTASRFVAMNELADYDDSLGYASGVRKQSTAEALHRSRGRQPDTGN
jgi:Ca-activated chloride channel family protein